MKLRKWLAAAAVLAMASSATTVSAGVIFQTGNHPQPGENNILFMGPETGTTISGEIDHSGVAVDFSSLTGQTLNQNAQGQASIEEINKNPLTSMFVTVPGYGFGDFILNLQNGTGIATVTATDSTAGTFTYTLGPGQNFLTITVDPGDFLTSVSVMMSPGGGFDVFKQPRISEACVLTAPTDCVPALLPEPQSLALLGLGLVVLGFVRRRSAG